MKIRHIPAALLLAFPAPAEAAGNLTGNWATAPTGDGNSVTLCSFTQKGNALSGTCSTSGNSGQGPFGPVSGNVVGQKVTWTWPIQFGEGAITVVYTAEWDLKDTLTAQKTVKNIPPGAIVNKST